MPYAAPAEPPEHVAEWFRAKGLVPSFDWYEVWADEHQVAFTVAKMMERDLLSFVRDAVGDAIEHGLSLEAFKKRLTPRLQQAGWWGRRLGSPSRLELIYDTNVRTSLAAGQWDRIDQTTDTHPYLLYQLGPSRIHRPVHVGWHGTLLPANDPWWASHFPPNGFGCKCWIRQVSREEVDEKRWKVSERPADRYVRVTDPRTGTLISMPAGIDPGWDISHRRSQRLDRLREALAAKGRAA